MTSSEQAQRHHAANGRPVGQKSPCVENGKNTIIVEMRSTYQFSQKVLHWRLLSCHILHCDNCDMIEEKTKASKTFQLQRVANLMYENPLELLCLALGNKGFLPSDNFCSSFLPLNSVFFCRFVKILDGIKGNIVLLFPKNFITWIITPMKRLMNTKWPMKMKTMEYRRAYWKPRSSSSACRSVHPSA